MFFLSIIIPAYNEEKRIKNTLAETIKYLNTLPYSSEIVVVNDGSIDRTVEVVNSFKESGRTIVRVLQNPGNRGKGFSVRNGMLNAEGEILLFMDADLATPLSEIEKVVKPLSENLYDVVFGSRALDRSLIGTHESKLREAIGKVGNLTQYLFTGLTFKDTQCGFKAFRREAAQAVFPFQSIDGFGFDPEILFIAKKQGWRLLETPVRWNHVEGSKVNPFTDPIKVLMEVAMIKWNALTGKYNNKSARKEENVYNH